MFRALKDTRPFVGEPGARVWVAIDGERDRASIDLLAACLMPDHLHVIARPRERDIVRWVNGFKSYSTAVYRGEGPRSAIWQPSFYDRRIRDESEYVAAVRYVAMNPVVANLVEDWGLWPWTWVSESDLLA